jgi:hypothetical protein
MISPVCAAAGNVNHMFTNKCLDQRGFISGVAIPMAQPPTIATAPRVQVSIRSERKEMFPIWMCSQLDHFFVTKTFNLLGTLGQ